MGMKKMAYQRKNKLRFEAENPFGMNTCRQKYRQEYKT